MAKRKQAIIAPGEPNSHGSFTYNRQEAIDQGYKEGFKYALTWTLGRPVPTAVNSTVAKGHKYNAEYVEGYKQGLNDGISSRDEDVQRQWAKAYSHAKNAKRKRASQSPFAPGEFDAECLDCGWSGDASEVTEAPYGDLGADWGDSDDSRFGYGTVYECPNCDGAVSIYDKKQASKKAQPTRKKTTMSSRNRRRMASDMNRNLMELDQTPSAQDWWGEHGGTPGHGAADVANVPTPGAENSYPQPTNTDQDSAISENAAEEWDGEVSIDKDDDMNVNLDKVEAFQRRVLANLRREAMRRQADANSTMQKGKRLKDSGQVEITDDYTDEVYGNVFGDTGYYEVFIQLVSPGSKVIAAWSCNCKYGAINPKHLCSHAYALYFEWQSENGQLVDPDLLMVAKKFVAPRVAKARKMALRKKVAARRRAMAARKAPRRAPQAGRQARKQGR